MSVLDKSVENVIKTLEGIIADEGAGVDLQALLEEERAGENRKTLIAWLEKQDAQGSGSVSEVVGEVAKEAPEQVEASVPDAEPVHGLTLHPKPVLAGPNQATRDYIDQGQVAKESPEVKEESDFKIVDQEPDLLFEINTKGEFILRGKVIAEDIEVANRILALPYPVVGVAVAGIDSIEGGVLPINELIDALCQKRDRWQRSTSCGLENIKVHLSDIQITVP